MLDLFSIFFAIGFYSSPRKRINKSRMGITMHNMSMKKKDASIAPPPAIKPWLGNMRFSEINMNHQKFDLPRATVLYMIKAHKSAAFQKKFMRLCKFTYDKNRIVPIFRLQYTEFHGKWVWCGKSTPNDPHTMFDIDLENGDFKLWITGDDWFNFLDEQMPPDTISKLLEKTYRWDHFPSLVGQILTLDEFKFLCNGTSDEIDLAYGTVIDEHGSTVSIKNVLECIPAVDSITYHFLDAKLIGKKVVMKEVTSIIEFSLKSAEMKFLDIRGLTDEFDIDAIDSFLMNAEKIRVRLLFVGEFNPEFIDKLKNLNVRFQKRYCRLRGDVTLFYPGQNDGN